MPRSRAESIFVFETYDSSTQRLKLDPHARICYFPHLQTFNHHNENKATIQKWRDLLAVYGITLRIYLRLTEEALLNFDIFALPVLTSIIVAFGTRFESWGMYGLHTCCSRESSLVVVGHLVMDGI